MNAEKLVPHRGAMLLIDEEPFFDESRQLVVTAFTPRAGGVFFDAELKGVPAWAAIEYVAQAAAACAGYADLKSNPGSAPRPGLLLGSRKVSLFTDRFKLGVRHEVTAKCSFSDGESAAFECAILFPDGSVAASAVLSAYRPDDFRDFLSR